MKFRGHIKVKVDGRLVFEDHNLITNAGIAHIAGLLCGVQTTPLKYVALGTGSDPVDVADTELQTEKTDDGAARKIAQTISLEQETVPDDQAQLIATFDITDDFDLTELGLLDSAVAGVLGAHRTFSPVTVLAGQTVVVTWLLTVTAEEELIP